MILDCSGWAYSSKGWEAAFLPITNCTKKHIVGDDRSIPGVSFITEIDGTMMITKSVQNIYKYIESTLNTSILSFELNLQFQGIPRQA